MGGESVPLIRLAGKGQEGVDGGGSGNLYLKVVFAKNPDFRVRDADLYYDLLLSPWEALLSANVHIPTLEGAVSLKIPAGTKAERRFRLRGKGLPTAGGTRGNLFAIVSIHVPSHLTAEKKNCGSRWHPYLHSTRGGHHERANQSGFPTVICS